MPTLELLISSNEIADTHEACWLLHPVGPGTAKDTTAMLTIV